MPATEEPPVPPPPAAGVTLTCLSRLSDWMSDLILMGVPLTLLLGVLLAPPLPAEEGVP